MVTKKLLEHKSKFICKLCDYCTDKNSSYTKHLLTAKHIMVTNGDKKVADENDCECGKTFKYRQGLSRHKKRCKKLLAAPDRSGSVEVRPNELSAMFQKQGELILDLVHENQEFKQMLAEQNKQVVELAKNAGHVTNNTNCNNTTNNNKFNLNFFLNETCKDAITMNEFINSIEVSMDDFICTGNIGFVEGISKVMIERIKDMEMHTRPMHCTDLKRETIYIKNDEKWEREDRDKTRLRSAVKNVANKNYNQLRKWYDSSKPNVEQIGSDDCENYFKYYKASLGGYDKEEDKKFEEKIIKNLLRGVVLDKNV